MSRHYLFNRILMALPTLLGVAVLVFVLVRVVPGDPVSMMIPPGANEADIARLRAHYGLDAPIGKQFLVWMSEMATGDFGHSISLRESVVSLVLGRLPATLELVFIAISAACAFGVTLAVLGVYLRGSIWEALLDGITGFALAIPDFLWGLLLVLTLGVLWPLLPITGRIDPTLPFEPSTHFLLVEALLRGQLSIGGDIVRHMLLPATALALPLTAAIARVLKGSLADAMNQDYVTHARVKGYSHFQVLTRVALRNALVPAVTLTGVQFSFLIGGTVLIEHIFAYPGIGNLSIAAVIQRDLPLIQALVLMFAVLFILTNLLVDFTTTLLNPRVRHS